MLDLEEEGRLSTDQAKELKRLQMLADALVNLQKPDESSRADEIIENLKRRGMWEE